MPQDIVKAALTYDRPKTEEAVNNLTSRVRAGQSFEERPLKLALTALRDNRWFDLLQTTADMLIQAGDTRIPVRRLYAQGLIDNGVLSAAMAVLEDLIHDAKEGDERDDARGILGRAWKQAYVTDENLAKPLAKNLMERSLEQYYTPYAERPEVNLYQGVNAMAMLARANADGVKVSGAYPDHKKLARTILDAATVRSGDAWDYAIAAEACVALKDWKGALTFLQRYLADPYVTAFAAAGTLRQFVEVWRLSGTGDGEGGALVHLLEAEMLEKRGGQEVDVSRASAAVKAIDAESSMLQAVLGDEKYKTLEWYRTGLARSSGVARIAYEGVGPKGTGFLVNLGDEQLLVTNHHVIPDAVPSDRAVVTFESLDGGRKKYRVREVLWTSPVANLDATIVRLDKNVKGIDAFPLCAAVPPLDNKPRVYVIGHPLGGTLSFSISDNLLIDHVDPKLHYRTPTDPGSSGSPVFDEGWALLGLHHAGGTNMKKLSGKGSHAANEGFSFNAIAKAFTKSRARSKRK